MSVSHSGRIVSITLENFKGIREHVKIPLRPITLLFGKNSAGKSTILQILLYAREILRTGRCDIDKVGLGGDAINLGGFNNFVHRDNTGSDHNLEKQIKLRFDIEIKGLLPYIIKDDDYLNPNLDSDTYFEIDDIEANTNESENIDTILRNTTSIYVEFVIKSPADGYLSKTINIGINDEQIFSLAWNRSKKNSSQKPISPKGNSCQITINKEHFLAQKSDIVKEFIIPKDQTEIQINDSNDNFNEELKTIEVEDILPCIGFPFIFPVENSQCGQFLNRCIMRPLQILKNLLDDVRYIGPIREILPRDYGPHYTQDNERWASGLAAWDILMDPNLKDEELLQKVNAALENLQLGYELHKRHLVALELNDKENIDGFRTLAEKLSQINEENLKIFLQNEPKLKGDIQVYLKEKKNGIEVALCDIGVGISQVIPVVVGALANDPDTEERPSILAIEQPELHVHPAVQCELGDLFIRECKNQMFLIETHSEHLILRLLRRIKETRNKSLPDPQLEISPNDLSVLTIDSDDCTDIEQMDISSKGKILSLWPGGFFEERFNELYGG